MSGAASESATGREIAVIGMAGRFPRARNLREFWRNLRDGVESVTFFEEQELVEAGADPRQVRQPNFVKAASPLEDADLFDAAFFGYNASDAEILDPQQRLFLEHAWETLEDAGYAPREYEGLIGVYAGVAWNTYLLSNLTTHPELFEDGGFQVFIASDKDFMPTRAAYKFNLRGPGMIVQTSCSTSLVAAHLACLSLLNYECDMALAGGVTVKVPQKAGYFHHPGGLASPDGHCRAFDARAAGTIFGSGVGVVLLKRLAEALEDGDCIRAVIKASAINNDGSAKISYTAPSVEGQSQAIAAAQAMAGFPADSIGYIEAHGTGTSLGDPVEITALTKAFRKHTARNGFCAIGSVKSNIGHLDAAAGIAGLLKTVLALEHGELPPSINFERPNPAIDFDATPFYVNAKLAAWESGGTPRRAGVSSFGVGGTNAHALLEQAPDREASGPSRAWQLLTLSARTPAALEAATANLLAALEGQPDIPLADAAFTLNVGRTAFRQRRILVCRDRQDALQALQREDASRLPTWADSDEPRERPVVFLFSGQGAQYAGMARQLHQSEPVFRAAFERCSEILLPLLGFDLGAAVFDAGPEADARLRQTALAQPAIFAVEYALAQLWMEWGIRPAAMLGHSIGEYTAACLAGVMTLADALALVAARGRLMQQQPPGSMLAVSLPEDQLAPLLTPELSLAAVNHPEACVVSGPAQAVAELERDLARGGTPCRPLRTSHAFHSAMLDPVLDPFAAQARQLALQPPRIPFISNVTGAWITAEQATSPAYWARHLRETVRFAAGLQTLFADPERVLLEVGPGGTLATLANRHPDRRGPAAIASLRHPQENTPDLAVLLEALGRLWMAGVKLDWARFYSGERRQRVPLPTYPFERQRFWIEPRERAAPSAGLARTPDAADWFYVPYWKPAPKAGQRPSEGAWMLLADGRACEELGARLRQDGREVVTVASGAAFAETGEHAYALRPGDPEDYRRLAAALQARAGAPPHIVHAFCLAPVGAARSAQEFERAQEPGFYSLLALLQALAAYPGREFDITVAASGAAVGAPDGAGVPERSTLLGLCRVAAQEFPNLKVRLLDLQPPEDGSGWEAAAAAILSEAARPAPEAEVVWRHGRRWTRAFEPARLEQPPDAAPLRERGVYLITGALAGNGFGVARYLARAAHARLALLTGADERDQERRASVRQRLEELGAQVTMLDLDLADAGEWGAAWERVEAGWGPVNGVIHAVEPDAQNAFRSLEEARREDCAAHFRPRAHALYAIEQVLRDRRCDFCVLISSIAAVLGGVGYGPYASASLFLDAFAAYANRAGGTPWMSLDWDLWLEEDGGGRMIEARGDLAGLAMTAEEGERALARALAVSGVDRLVVSTAEVGLRRRALGQRLDQLRARLEASETGEPAALHPRPALASAFVAAGTGLERTIAAVWQAALGFDRIGVEDNFFELGGDSLIAIRVAARLKQELNMDFPVAKLYQGVTIRALALVLGEDAGQANDRLAGEFAERKQAAVRRRDYLEGRRSRAREAEV